MHSLLQTTRPHDKCSGTTLWSFRLPRLCIEQTCWWIGSIFLWRMLVSASLLLVLEPCISERLKLWYCFWLLGISHQVSFISNSRERIDEDYITNLPLAPFNPANSRNQLNGEPSETSKNWCGYDSCQHACGVSSGVFCQACDKKFCPAHAKVRCPWPLNIEAVCHWMDYYYGYSYELTKPTYMYTSRYHIGRWYITIIEL